MDIGYVVEYSVGTDMIAHTYFEGTFDCIYAYSVKLLYSVVNCMKMPVLAKTHWRNHNQVHPTSKRKLILIALSILVGTLLLLSWIGSDTHQPSSSSSNNYQCKISLGTYSGTIYANPNNTTLYNKCLVESPWMRLSQHTVQLPPTSPSTAPANDNKEEEEGMVIDDWLFIDYHDRINVLVAAPYSQERNEKGEVDSEPQFIILEQTKYALYEPSYAIVGGIIEPGGEETPAIAAQREVNEELNIQCEQWKSLGKYRTDVNRGMGWVSY